MLAGIPVHTNMKLTIDQDKCIHCHLCEKACFLTRFCGFDSLEGAAEQYCIDCGHCVAVCPRQAITHSGVKSTEPIGPVPGEAEVLNLLMKPGACGTSNRTPSAGKCGTSCAARRNTPSPA